LRDMENTAKQGTRLRRWWATGSDENASKKLYVSNGRKGTPHHHHHHHYHPCYDFLFFLLSSLCTVHCYNSNFIISKPRVCYRRQILWEPLHSTLVILPSASFVVILTSKINSLR
jgi:hypothetical protein